jgi:hypothetical protein
MGCLIFIICCETILKNIDFNNKSQ